MISSAHPSTYYNQWVNLDDDGTVYLPAPDDGFTSVGAKGTTAGQATTTEEAVTLVVREVSDAVRVLTERQAQHLQWARPAVQPPVPDDDLAEACTLWQGGRDVGSSPVRAAARVLSGVDHYFRADFISDYNRQARTTPEALAAGVALLRAVNAAPHRDANGWSDAVGLPAGGFAGRGITSKPDEDPQIEWRLSTGRIEMPLWGVSLSPDVAAGFGTRFLFELVGDFPAVPAWVHSGDQGSRAGAGDRRAVPGAVAGGARRDPHVRLQWFGASGDRVGSDPLLLAVLGAVPGVVHQRPDASRRRRGARAAPGPRCLGHGHPGTGFGQCEGRPLLGARSRLGRPGRRRVQPMGRHARGLTDDDGTGGDRRDRRRRLERQGERMTTLEARAEMGAGPLSERFDEALMFAARHHREQLRKGSRVPYMSHLMSVSALVLEHGGTEDQAIAALLHDAVEDAPAGQGGAVLADIRSRFGGAVADMVAACSDGLDDLGERHGTWQERKQAYVDGLPHKSLDALLVTAADKTHNGLCIAADVRRYGQRFWPTFNASPEELVWYYTSVRDVVAERLPDTSIAPALDRAVAELVAAAGT
ncbi:HD domain-containing protein [Blastococcus sp. SYSU DS0510]